MGLKLSCLKGFNFLNGIGFGMAAATSAERKEGAFNAPGLAAPGLKTCVSSGDDGSGTPDPAPGEKNLHVPSIIVTPPTPTGTTLSREARRVGGPCSQC